MLFVIALSYLAGAFEGDAAEPKKEIPDYIEKYLVKEEIQREEACEKIRAEFLEKIVDVKPAEREALAQKYQILIDGADKETRAKIGYFLKVGDVGYFKSPVRVIQVIDDHSLLIRTGPTEAFYILRGFPTDEVADDDLFKVDGFLNVTGTESYETVSGAKKTVKVIERIDDEEIQEWRTAWLHEKTRKTITIEIPPDIDQLYMKSIRDKKAAAKKNRNK